MLSLCSRLLCGRGGVGLAKSLLCAADADPDHPDGDLVPTWCICGNCREMETPPENVCCGKRSCVTNYEHFFGICVDHQVLTVAILNRADIRADPIPQEATGKLHTGNLYCGHMGI